MGWLPVCGPCWALSQWFSSAEVTFLLHAAEYVAYSFCFNLVWFGNRFQCQSAIFPGTAQPLSMPRMIHRADMKQKCGAGAANLARFAPPRDSLTLRAVVSATGVALSNVAVGQQIDPQPACNWDYRRQLTWGCHKVILGWPPTSGGAAPCLSPRASSPNFPGRAVDLGHRIAPRSAGYTARPRLQLGAGGRERGAAISRPKLLAGLTGAKNEAAAS